jgi:hypothetical protein
VRAEAPHHAAAAPEIETQRTEKRDSPTRKRRLAVVETATRRRGNGDSAS